MRSLVVAICAAGIIAVLVLPAVYAQDGTPNLGTAQIENADGNRWFIEVRGFDTGDPVADWKDNRTQSIGFRAPINDNTEFSLIYSDARGSGTDRNFPMIMHANDVVDMSRKVLSPAIKRRFTSRAASCALALSIGADVAVETSYQLNLDTGQRSEEDDFTPAARLQAEWGAPGRVQYQLAAQVAVWNSWRGTNMGYAIPGFETVAAVGAGLIYPINCCRWPFGGKIAFVGDVMFPVSGYNVINEDSGNLDDRIVWSYGGNWEFGDRANTILSLYATNALGPTLGSSIIGAPEDTIGVGGRLIRSF